MRRELSWAVGEIELLRQREKKKKLVILFKNKQIQIIEDNIWKCWNGKYMEDETIN